jgi:hypothetical protein
MSERLEQTSWRPMVSSRPRRRSDFEAYRAGPAPGRKAARAGGRFPDGSLIWNFWATHDARHQKNLAD